MRRSTIVLLAVLLLANFVVLWGQSFVALLKWRSLSASLMPEARYYLQSLILLVPVVPLVLLRFRHGRKVLIVLLVALVAHAAGYFVKAHVPGTRRHQYLEACDWAVAVIRSDYRGPTHDEVPFFTSDDYHPPRRPAVIAHVNRVPYLLGGRKGMIFSRRDAGVRPPYIVDTGCVLADIPDYIVDEARKVNLDWEALAPYEKLAERTFGRRTFVIYRRCQGAGAK